MKSDAVIRLEGMKALCEKLGIVDAERFIFLMMSETFNYTEWQQELWRDKSIEDIFNAAKLAAEKESKQE